MKLALILLAATAVAQTPAPKPGILQSTGSITAGSTTAASTLTLTDAHGCNFYAQWDANKKVCAMHITFSSDMMPPITCSPVAKNELGEQSMVCWYTPTPGHKEPK